MDLLSPIVFVVAVITLVGLVAAAGFIFRRELGMRWEQVSAKRADHTRTDPSTESGGRVVYRRMRLNE